MRKFFSILVLLPIIWGWSLLFTSPLSAYDFSPPLQNVEAGINDDGSNKTVW